MSVLTAKKPRQDKLTAHQRLHQIDVRIAEAKAEANQLGRRQQLASQAAANADLDLIKAQGRHGAEQISDNELAQVRESFDVAKLEADKPWKRDFAVAQAKVSALEDERGAFLSQNSAELATEVTKRAQALRERMVRNQQERGELAADIVAVQGTWRAIGYTSSRFPLDNVAQQWRKEAQTFDPGSIPLIVPES